MAQTYVKAIPRIDLGAAVLIPAWQPLNPLGLPAACFAIRVVNFSNIAIDISYDGVVAHDWIRADSELYLYAFFLKPTKYRGYLNPFSNLFIYAKLTF